MAEMCTVTCSLRMPPPVVLWACFALEKIGLPGAWLYAQLCRIEVTRG